MAESKSEVSPELKELVGALVFGAKHPIGVGEIQDVLKEAAEIHGGATRGFAGAKEADIQAALAQIREECERQKPGFHLVEVANGFKFHSAPACGVWLRFLLNEQHGSRLSRPALETLAIIAYRQPVMRSEIESVRGVNVDHIIKLLLEMQLIRIVGRSDLPGRPLLYETTSTFLEHFGLRNVKDLPGIEELSRLELERQRKARAAGTGPPAESAPVAANEAQPPAGGPEPAAEAAPTAPEGNQP